MTEFVINKTIRIVTTFSAAAEGLTEAMPVIGYELFFPAYDPNPLMSCLLEGDNKQDIKYKVSAGFIHGYLSTTVTRDEMILTGNLYYGTSSSPALQNHFDGTIAVYPLREPVIPIEPVIPVVPAADSKEGIVDLAPGLSIGAPLFPYIDVQPWLQEATAAMPWQFFQYDKAHTTADSLYNKLIAPAKAKDRAAMETLALAFLEHAVPFDGNGQYFDNLTNVPSPFDRFPAIYDQLRKEVTHHRFQEILLKQTGHETPQLFSMSLQQTNYEEVIDQLWQNYFALVIFNGYQPHFFRDINKILLVVNLIEKLFSPPVAVLQPTEQDLLDLLQATVILPESIFPLPPYPSAGISAGFVEPYAIGHLKMTRYCLLGYREGEIARVHNILKGEKKKVTRRSLTQTGEQSVQHTHHASDQRDESKESSHELLTEVKKTVAKLTKTVNCDHFTVTYGPPNQATYNGSWKKEIIPDEDVPAKEEVNDFASRVLNKTLHRIQDSVFKARANQTFQENEETESSLFDNQQGDHFRGIYRWVNKVYRISLENYGYRFLLALEIENPAADFINSQLMLNNTNLVKLESPAQQNIRSFNDIIPENYIALLSYYQVAKSLLPPEEKKTASITLNQGATAAYIPVPPGYRAATATVTGQVSAGAALTEITGIIGTTNFKLTNSDPTKKDIALQQETSQVTVAVNGNSLPEKLPVQSSDFILVATITCTVSDNAMNEWKIAVYNEIMAAYQQLMQQYNNQFTRFAREDQPSNPLLLNNIEKSCLRNSCVDTLLQVHKVKVGEQPLVVPSGQMVIQQQYRQLMGTAFEWDEMTWCFDDQPAKYGYALQGADDSLRPFLQASAATVFLPVRPDYNFQVLYYLYTGLLWESFYPFIPVNSVGAAIAMQLKNVPHWHLQRQEEKHWHISLPTAIQVIQDGTRLPDFITSKYE